MSKLAALSLILGLALAVLAFGGAETILFSVVEVFFFGVAALLVVIAPVSAFRSSLKSLAVPAALTGVVLLQLCPLPESWLHR